MRKHFWCLPLFLVSIVVLAQKPDTTFYLSSTRTQNMFDLSDNSKAKDTTLDNTHNYYQIGVLGNMGLPSYSLIADRQQRGTSSFFNWNKLNNRNDLITEDDPMYFTTHKVYTKITAVMGQKVEQYLKLEHSQTIKKVNISLLFNRYSCLGFYQQQQSLVTNLLGSSNYKTDNGRWGYNFYYLFNKVKYQLNGGVNDSSLSSPQYIFQPKNIYPFDPIFSSLTARANIKTSNISFSTFYRLNKNDTSKTVISEKGDTTYQVTPKKASHYLVYETNYQSNYYLYVDGYSDTTAQFKNHLYSYVGQGSYDSTGSRVFSNSLLYKLKTANNNFIFYAGYRNEAIKYHQHFIDTVGFNHVARAGFILKVKKHQLSSTAEYVLAGFNKANYELDVNYRFTMKHGFYIDAAAQDQSRLPDFNLMFYNGNRFFWQNNFSAVQTQNIKVSIVNKRYKFYVGVFSQMQQNQIYCNTDALPTQYKGSTNITRLFAGKDLRLWHIHINNNINYQLTKDTNIIRLPNWVTTHQLYYESKLFKNNLWLQIGFQARYISSYKANAYMPATNQFYLQNDKYYGDYVFIDFFISAEIYPVRFFILATHLNQGFMGGNYILTPNYPMPDRSFKFGLTWLLFN
ncbi:MAG: putative porin [Bacteroidia bacterium]